MKSLNFDNPDFRVLQDSDCLENFFNPDGNCIEYLNELGFHEVTELNTDYSEIINNVVFEVE